MKLFKCAIVMAAILAVLAAVPGSASAHADKVYHGKDFATVTSDHLAGNVCDEEADGHAVFAIWYLENGEQYGAYDNGSGGNCTSTDAFESPAYKFKVCEEGKGCRQEWT
jgi:hypothetical protein